MQNSSKPLYVCVSYVQFAFQKLTSSCSGRERESARCGQQESGITNERASERERTPNMAGRRAGRQRCMCVYACVFSFCLRESNRNCASKLKKNKKNNNKNLAPLRARASTKQNKIDKMRHHKVTRIMRECVCAHWAAGLSQLVGQGSRIIESENCNERAKERESVRESKSAK